MCNRFPVTAETAKISRNRTLLPFRQVSDLLSCKQELCHIYQFGSSHAWLDSTYTSTFCCMVASSPQKYFYHFFPSVPMIPLFKCLPCLHTQENLSLIWQHYFAAFYEGKMPFYQASSSTQLPHLLQKSRVFLDRGKTKLQGPQMIPF